MYFFLVWWSEKVPSRKKKINEIVLAHLHTLKLIFFYKAIELCLTLEIKFGRKTTIAEKKFFTLMTEPATTSAIFCVVVILGTVHWG